MILMNDFNAEPAGLKQEIASAVEQVLGSGWYVLGDRNRAFESSWAKACGMREAIGCANGLDALEIALRALGIGPGDEVVTTPMTAFATVLAVLRAGATPVLADIRPETGLLCPHSVERCLSKRTRAMILVHLYGHITDMEYWTALSRNAGIVLLEDCAQAHLARWSGKFAGSFGPLGAYSFYPTKNLGAFGDAGALVTDDLSLAEHCRRLRNYGQSERYHHPDLGMNSRLDELQAAILSVRLKWLEHFTARRRDIAARYRAGLSLRHLTLLAPPEQPECHVYHLFVVTTPHRDALQRHLAADDIQTHIHYPVPVHHQPPCSDLRMDPAGLAAAEQHARLCLSLPCHPQLSDSDVDLVIDAVNRFEP